MANVIPLRQSTAATLLLGPFLDETDGKTAETALTISQADVLLWKQGGTTLAQKNESTSATHRSNGLYTVPIDTTDTNTLGVLSVSVHESGALPVRQDYTVLPAVVWDEMFDAGFAYGLRGIASYGTAQSATGTTVVLAAGESMADDVTIGQVLGVYGSTQAYWQFRVITDYVNSTDTATVDTWTVTPSGTITYVRFASPPADATNIPAVNVTKVGGQTASAAGTVTFPGTIASTTNITAATGVTLAAVTHTGAVIPTVTTTTTATNLTNAPTSGDLTATMKTSVKTQITDALNVDTYAEPGSVPSATATLVAKIGFLMAKARNKVTQTATTQLVRNDADAATIATSTVSDDGTTFTRGKFV